MLKNRIIKRIYHPYWLWEEVKYNMWGSVGNRQLYLERAIIFTSNHKLYGSFMRKVIIEWKYSCEHNLSNLSQNRQAWLGHAACAYAFQCPENIVRLAWHHLTEAQRVSANKQADKYIKLWEENNAKAINWD